MKIRNIRGVSISSILKNNLYLNGILVSDKMFELLNNSQYNGYRTTTGIFMKLGGTLSKLEFEKLKLNPNKATLFSKIPETLSYEEYLKVREYTTANLKKYSAISKKYLTNHTHFILDSHKNGKLYITGQYIHADKKYPIQIEDCGFFQQEKYVDNLVIPQAGGIRLRASICGENCISGCKFCDFGKNSESYLENTLNRERKNYITTQIKQLVSNGKTQILFITGGNPSLNDMENWTEFVAESIHTFKKSVPNGIVDVMLTPRGFGKYVYDADIRYEAYRKYLEYLKSVGVTTISPNMELWQQEDLNTYCSVSPSQQNIGTTKSEIEHDGYLDFIKAGIDVFGKYHVRTSFIVGLNSNENIKKAIKVLIPLGCYVVLLPFKAPMRRYDSFHELEPKDDDLIELSHYLKHQTNKYFSSLPINLSETYNKRISSSLNAHNSHNTANLCCGQDLDFIEQQTLSTGKQNSIIGNIKI